MTDQLSKLEQRLRRAGIIVAIGLVVELISLLWNHPTAFFLFMAGALFLVAGVLFYFYSLVTVHEPSPEDGTAKAEGL